MLARRNREHVREQLTLCVYVRGFFFFCVCVRVYVCVGFVCVCVFVFT